MHESPRTRRLRSDHSAMRKLASESTILSFESPGPVHDFYRVTFCGAGTCLDAGGGVAQTTRHVVEIWLGAEYPRIKPTLAWKTPIHHPNISAAGSVCLGGYSTNWAPSVGLADLCSMLWDMIRYANFDVRSPFNAEAATWAASQPDSRFPLDERPVRDLLARSRSREGTVPKPPPSGTARKPPGSGGKQDGGIIFIGGD